MGDREKNVGLATTFNILSWHLLEDALGWIVLLTGAVTMRFWDKPVIDPLMTIGFTIFVLWGAYNNAKETFNILLEGVPKNIDIDQIMKSIFLLKE